MYVLVDLGYLLFYRYHASMRWIEFQKDGGADGTCVEYVIGVFRKHLEAQLVKLGKKFKGQYLFCQDERQCDIWRKDLYPEYKANRGVADDMVRQLKEVLLDVVSRYGKVYGSPRLEADDVAFLLVRRLREVEPDAEIVVVTSDRDYLQMTDEKVRLIDGTGKWITGCGDAQKDLMIKVIMGDKSDNIPPIAKGCGKKTAETLASDPQALAAYIAKHDCAEAFERNRQLVRMDLIPQMYQDAFYATLGGGVEMN